MPGSGDTAIFDGTSTANCNLNVNVNVAGLTVASGYTGTITQDDGVTITIGSVGFSQGDGVFLGGDSAITLNGPAVFTGGSFTSTSGTLTANGDWTVSGAPTFADGAGTVTFAVVYSGTQTVTPGAFAFNNVTIVGFGNYSTQAVSGTLVVNGALVFDIHDYSGNKLNGGTIQANGDITMNNAGFGTQTSGPGTTLIQITGTGAQTLAAPTTGHFPSIEVAKPSGTLTVTGSPVLAGDWTWTSGDANFGTSTLDFTAPYSGTQTITPGTIKYGDVIIKGFGNYSSQTINGTMDVGGSLAFEVSDYSGNRLNGGVIQAEGDVMMGSAGFGTLNPGPGSVTIDLIGTGDQTLSSPAAGYFPSIQIAKPSGSLTVTDSPLIVGDWTWSADPSVAVNWGTSHLNFAVAYGGSQSITPGDITYGDVSILGNGQSSTQTVNGTLTVGGSLTFGTSGFGGNHLNGGTIAALGDVTMTSPDFGGGVDGAGSTTLVLSGTGSQTLEGNGTGHFPNVVIQKDSGTLTMTGSIYVTGNWNQVSGDVAAAGSSEYFVTSENSQISGDAVFGDLIADKNWAITVTINQNATVQGNLQILANSLAIPNLSTVTVGGNILMGVSGTFFTDPHATFVLNGTSAQSIDFGSNTVHSLTVANTAAPVTFVSGITSDFYSTTTFEPGSSVQFTAGQTYAFDNLVATGTATQPISFASTAPGQTWALKLPLRYAVYHVNVTDSNASSGAPVTAINSTDDGDNTNWVFGTPAALAITTPNSSVTSPAWVEGSCGVDASSVQASINGGTAFDAVRLSASSWFADNASAGGASLGISLNQLSATNVSIKATSATGDATTATQSITWATTDLTGESISTVLMLRKGDSLLLTANGPGTVLTIDANGDGTADYTGVPGDKFAYRYTTPGSFTAQAYIDGNSVGAIEVDVVGVDMNKPLAAQIGYTRTNPLSDDMTISPASETSSIVLSAADPLLVTEAIVNDGGTLTEEITPHHRGDLFIEGRLGAKGPIVAFRAIDEYTLDSKSLSRIVVDAATNVGTTKLVMRPYISGLTFNFSMFAHTSTFSGGQTTLSATTDTDFGQVSDSATQEIDGVLTFNLEVPQDETSYCYSVSVLQNPICGSLSINGSVCLVSIDHVAMNVGDIKPLDINILRALPGGPFPVILTDADGSPSLGIDGGQPYFVGSGDQASVAAIPSLDASRVGTVSYSIAGGGDPGGYGIMIDDTQVYADDVGTVTVGGVSVEINDTPDGKDNITSVNPAQTIPVKITYNTGNPNTATVTLSVTPATAGTLSTNTLTLTKGQGQEVTYTPAANQASKAPNDIVITATSNTPGVTGGSDKMTNVLVTVPQDVRATDTPEGMPDRIPNRVNTPETVSVSPDLTNSGGQTVTVAVTGQSATTNGTLLVNGNATANLVKTTTIQLQGGAQTAPTAAPGGGNASKLKLVAQVRGAIESESNGFSVAAICSEIKFSAGRVVRAYKIVLPNGNTQFSWGAQYPLTYISDSGVQADLDQVKVSEQISLVSATGASADFPITVSGPRLATITSDTDAHVAGGDAPGATVAQVATAIQNDINNKGNGTSKYNQHFIQDNLRTGSTGKLVPKSGFTITEDFEKDAEGAYSITVTKLATAQGDATAGTVANNDKVPSPIP
ncbi:MAG: beta strand repeat-containing protein [Rhodanobacteraceae bacterium]